MGTLIACFVAGAGFSIIEFFLAKKVFSFENKPGYAALYIAQLLILSLALLAVMLLVSEAALLISAAGMIITQLTLAVGNSLKR